MTATRIRRIGAAVVALVVLAGCDLVYTVEVEPLSGAGYFDVEAIDGGGLATWGCYRGETGPAFGEGLQVRRADGTRVPMPDLCEGIGTMAVAGGFAYILQSRPVPEDPSAVRLQVDRVDLETGAVEVLFQRPVPPTVTWPVTVGHIDATAAGEVVITLIDYEARRGALYRVTGPTTAVELPGTERVGAFELDPAGGIVAAAPYLVVHIDDQGNRTPLAGGGASRGDGVPALTAWVSPQDIALTPSGDILVSASGIVRKVVRGGTITTVAGGGTDQAEGAVARRAQLYSLSAIASDVQDGCFWYADHFVPDPSKPTERPGRIRFVGPRSCPGHPDHQG